MDLDEPDSFAEAERWVNLRRRLDSPEPWVAAVSGGSDSVGLLRFLHGLGVKLSVAHLDHGTRGEASRLDAEFVADLAESLHLPFDLGRWKPFRDSHFEADARKARIDWLGTIAAERGASAVVLGHTLDDQAETVLHRALRGTGLRGLAGIPARRSLPNGVSLLRPFLAVTRAEIRSRLAHDGQSFREDLSNQDRTRTRARLRHDLIPKLEAEYNPKVVEALGRLARFAAESNRAAERRVEKIEKRALVHFDSDSIGYDKITIVRLSSMDRIELFRRGWHRFSWPEREMDAARWKQLAHFAVQGEGRFSIGSGIEAEVNERGVTLRKVRPEVTVSLVCVSSPLSIPGLSDWSGAKIIASLDDSSAQETVDLDRIVPPLEVRGGRPGDRFEPLGLKGRGMPLNDFFRGRKVAQKDRANVPLVCDRSGIIWVAGHRISDRVRLSETTSRRLGLSVLL